MHRALKALALSGVVLAAACGDSSRMPADLQNDLALASAGADLELASRSTGQTRIIGAVERTTPPSTAIASSARAPRPRRSPTPRVMAPVQEESEIVQEPEVAAQEADMPATEPADAAPVEIAASTRPRAVEPSSAGAGSIGRGGGWGTIIGIAGAVVIRGGDVGEDRCIPPEAGRGGTSISINHRLPQPRGPIFGGAVMGGRTGGRSGGRQVIYAAPPPPRDVMNSRPVSPPSAIMRPMAGGGSGAITSSIVREGRPAANRDLQ